jgi:opacity protein-like surface antigen
MEVRTMVRKVAILSGAMLFTAATVFAQENVGAGRVEVGAIPAGGLVFLQSDDGTQPKFNNYVLGASVAGNFNRYVGLEGDLTFAVGRRQSLDFTTFSVADQKTPNLWNYNGSVIVNPWGKDKAVVPYVAAGLGGLTLMNSPDTANIGLTTNQTYLTTNVGGGVRWFPMPHWGLRGDYRYFMVNSVDTAPSFFALTQDRHANRVYGSVIFTY